MLQIRMYYMWNSQSSELKYICMWTAKRLGLEEDREPVWNYLVPKKNKISERSYFRMGSDIAQQNTNDDNKQQWRNPHSVLGTELSV